MDGVLTSLENFGNSLLGPLTDPFAAATPVPASPTPVVISAKPTPDSGRGAGAASTPIGVLTSIPAETTLRTRTSTRELSQETATSSDDSTGTSVVSDVTSSSDPVRSQSSRTTFDASVSPTAVPPPAPINPTSSDAASQDTTSPNSGNGVSTAGIVIAAIIAFAMLATTLYLLFRFCPPVRRWWDARRNAGREDRSYREALDGPRSSDESYSKENYVLPYAHTREEKAAARRTFIEKVRRSRAPKSASSGAGLGLGPVTPIRAHPEFNDTPRTRSWTSMEPMPTGLAGTPTTEEVITLKDPKPPTPPKDRTIPQQLSPVSPIYSEPSTARVSQIGLALSSPSEARIRSSASPSLHPNQHQQVERRAHARFSFEPE